MSELSHAVKACGTIPQMPGDRTQHIEHRLIVEISFAARLDGLDRRSEGARRIGG
jgi:hypothetical protein